jgi:SAM-dependent methyltransferase
MKNSVDRTGVESWGLGFRALSPVRALMKRWGTKRMKQIAWEAEFRTGHNLHDVSRDYRSKLCHDIEKYSNGGNVLDLGCSDGHIGLGLAANAYSSYTGVDISEIATNEARAKVAKIHPDRVGRHEFYVGDIASFEPRKNPDLIVFKDSLYYLPKQVLAKALDHYRSCLNPNGVFIVQMDTIDLYGLVEPP